MGGNLDIENASQAVKKGLSRHKRGTVEIIQLPLSDIIGLHPNLVSLYEDLSVPVMRKNQPGKELTVSEIRDLLSSFPLTVTRLRSGMYCIGNVRLYQIASNILPSNEKIRCVLEKGARQDILTRRALTEMLIAPACLGVHHANLTSLVAVAKRERLKALEEEKTQSLAKDQVEEEIQKLEKRFAKIYRVDQRSLREKTEPDEYEEEKKLIETELRIYPEE